MEVSKHMEVYFKKEITLHNFKYTDRYSFKHLKHQLSRNQDFVEELFKVREDNHLFGKENKFKKFIPRDECLLIEKYTGVKIVS